MDGAKIVGKGGKAIGPNYLLDRWLKGEDAGPFKNEYHIGYLEIFGRWIALLDCLCQKRGSERW
jgi:hypothetical protein